MRRCKTGWLLAAGGFLLLANFPGRGDAAVPGKATLVSPSGHLTGTTTAFTWRKVPESTWYYLWVNDSTGNKVKSWYTAAQAGCASSESNCSVALSNSFTGQGQWWVRTWNSEGYGPWSDGMMFTVANDGRTPISSLPYTISAPGSYYLAGDLTSASNGVTVEADHVTIDLMGHSIVGPGSGTNYGIYMNGRSNVEIRNGTVRDFGSHGIYEASSSGGSHRIINVRAVGNQGGGIVLYLVHASLVKDCTASENGSTGISAGYENIVTGNVVYKNGGPGIHTDWGALVAGNIVYDNAYDGISTSTSSTVRGNTAYDNGGDGIDAGPGNTVTENTAVSNGSDGIRVHNSSTVTGNTASYNQNYGIEPFSGACLLDRNTAAYNNQSGGGYTNISSCASCTFGLNLAP